MKVPGASHRCTVVLLHLLLGAGRHARCEHLWNWSWEVMNLMLSERCNFSTAVVDEKFYGSSILLGFFLLIILVFYNLQEIKNDNLKNLETKLQNSS